MEEEYILDLGIKRKKDYFFGLLIYLNEKGYENETNISEELCISKDELYRFYLFQKDIGYMNTAIDNNNARIYSLEERGIRAYKNLCNDRDRTMNASRAYMKYVETHPIGENPIVIKVKNSKSLLRKRNV